MKKLFVLLLLLLSFSFAVQFLSGGLTPGAVSVVGSPFPIGTAYFSVNPISNGYDYQNEPQKVVNPYYLASKSSFAIRLINGESVSIKVKLNDVFKNDFPVVPPTQILDAGDYLVGYNFVYPTTTTNITISEPRGYLKKDDTKVIGSITNATGADADYYVTMQWFFDLNKYKKIDSKVYDFTNAIEVIVE